MKILHIKCQHLKSNILHKSFLVCFQQETNQESWLENQHQEGIISFYELNLVNLKSCTQYKAKVELRFNNEPVKDSTYQPIPSITTPEFQTKPDTTILPDLRLISQTEDSANFKLTG